MEHDPFQGRLYGRGEVHVQLAEGIAGPSQLPLLRQQNPGDALDVELVLAVGEDPDQGIEGAPVERREESLAEPA